MNSRHSSEITRLLLVAGAAIHFAAAGVSAFAAATLPDAYRHLFEECATNGACPRLAVGVIEGTDQQTWTFGPSAHGEAARSGNDASFEIGAVTDVLTGLLLAQAVLDGKLRLNDPLRDALSPGLLFADASLGATSIAALATQDSALPSTPPNLFPAHQDDPYSAYASSDLFALLANYRAASSHSGYSALNAALLGVALERAYGEDFEKALASKVLEPLGMSNTGFAASSTLLAGHALGVEVPHWNFAALKPAAGLRSTLPDLLSLLHANLSPDSSPLRAALLLSRQPRGSAPGDATALGWNIHEVAADGQTWPLVWRASETGGFSVFIGFRTDRQQGIALLANSAVDLAPIGVSWLANTAVPSPPSAPALVATTDVDRYVGLYRLLSGTDATIRSEGNSLVIQLRGEPPWPLYALGDDAFVTSGGTVGITFIRNIDRISGLMLRHEGDFVAAERLSGKAPQIERTPLALDAKRLQEYAGDYLIDAETMLRITALPDSLSVQYTGTPPMLMRAVAPDRFADAVGANSLVFGRDEHGLAGVTIDLAGGERKASPARWRAPFAPSAMVEAESK